MIKPVNISNIGIEPIKVPHQNVSFSGISVSGVKKVAQKVVGEDMTKKIAEKVAPLYKKYAPKTKNIFEKATGYAKKVPEYLKKGGKFVAKKAKQLWKFAVNSLNNLRDITKNPGKKSRTIRNLAILAGTGTGIGAVGGIKKAVNNKKGSN